VLPAVDLAVQTNQARARPGSGSALRWCGGPSSARSAGC
jgi:hypothetical protein